MGSQTTEYKLGEAVTAIFRKYKTGMTAADVAAATGFSLTQIKRTLPSIADEYGARLRVSESGEIVYDFPNGLKSRYTGFGPTLKRGWRKLRIGAAKAASFLFKLWIAVTFVGYLVVFLLLVLGLIILSAASSARSNDSRSSGRRNGGAVNFYATARLLDAVSRILFYSSITGGYNSYDQQRVNKKESKRPLHKSIFSFVFGEGDPNESFDDQCKKAVVSFIRSHRGCITLEEFMIITGLKPNDAEIAILQYLKDYQGEPDVTENGTIVYMFPELLKRGSPDKTPIFSSGELSGVTRRLKKFSFNPTKTNAIYGVLNTVNLTFGLYFIAASATLNAGGSALYSFTRAVLSQAGVNNPAPIIAYALGVAPTVFSILFFATPLIRWLKEKKENEGLKTSNLRSYIYNRIWSKPDAFNPAEPAPAAQELRPANKRAAETAAREWGAAYGMEVDEGGSVYRYPEIAVAANDVQKYRQKINPEKYATGDIIFDSESSKID